MREYLKEAKRKELNFARDMVELFAREMAEVLDQGEEIEPHDLDEDFLHDLLLTLNTLVQIEQEEIYNEEEEEGEEDE